jgi:hypothetical protein
MNMVDDKLKEKLADYVEDAPGVEQAGGGRRMQEDAQERSVEHPQEPAEGPKRRRGVPVLIEPKARASSSYLSPRSEKIRTHAPVYSLAKKGTKWRKPR